MTTGDGLVYRRKRTVGDHGYSGYRTGARTASTMMKTKARSEQGKRPG